MSELDKPVPPAGEEIHLPDGSFQPILLTVFVTLFLVGVTTTWWISIIGGIGTVGVLVAWVRDAIRETNALPLHDDH